MDPQGHHDSRKRCVRNVWIFFVYIGWILWEEKTMAVINALKGLLHNKMETHGMKMLQKMFG